MTAPELQKKIDKFDELINGFGDASPSSKLLWQIRSEIREYFVITIFESVEEKNAAWERFESLTLLLHEKQDALTIEFEKFADEAERLIKEIESTVGEGFYKNNPEKEAIIQLKSQIDKVFDYFKQARWPSKERRTKAWDEFNIIRERLRKEEDEFYSVLREKKVERAERSLALTSIILETIEACHPDSSTNILYQLLQQLTEHLIGIGFSPESVEWILANKEAEPRAPLKMKSEGLREARRLLNENRDEIMREDKQRIYAKLETISTELNKAWDLHRQEQQKKQEEWEERKKLGEFKKVDWLAKQTEFLKVLDEKLEKRNADKANLERILTSKKDFYARQENRLQNQSAFLEKIMDDLADMQDKINTAWTESFKERLTEKIVYKESKIVEVKTDIEIVKVKLVEVEKDIIDISEKLGSIEKSIEELKLKKEEVSKTLQETPPQS
jgi:hypothetical protein